MSDVKISLSCGGFTSLLTILFITLKLCNVIDWSWWWILSPLWIGIGLWFFILLIVLITLLAAWMVT